jgi:mycothiol synthase
VSRGGLVLRAPRLEEAEAIADLLNAQSRALRGRDDAGADEIRLWLTTPTLDLAEDVRVAVLPDGSLAGYADLGDQANEHTRLWIDLRLHPERGDDAVANTLLDAMEARAADRALPGAVLRTAADERDEHSRRLFEARGYRVVRHSFRMEIAFDGPPAAPPLPDGFALRTFRPGDDDEAVYEAHQDSFADHWEYVRDRYDEWRHWFLEESLDPELWFLAEADGELAGVCLCRSGRGGDETLGWVHVLGVRPLWRRRGLGSALLGHAFVELHRRGHPRVGLGVDGENVTGAVALYERAGMSVVRRSDTYEKAL